MNSFAEFLKSMGMGRIMALGIVGIALIGFFAYVTVRISEPQMALMYSELTQDDAAQVISELDLLNIPYSLGGDGTKIFVPQDKVLRLRLSMAERGLPKGGSVGYEIFDNTDTLGTTSFVQNLNYMRALEGELARTIGEIDQVQGARVHLVLPEREIFSRERREPSASIVLRVRGDLSRAQVKSIQHLISSAVQGLKPGKVSIIDDQGNLLASGADEEDGMLVSGALEERNLGYERRVRKQVETIVASIVGPNKARVEVSAELDFNRITRTSDTYDPESQVARSTQTVEETSSAANGAAAQNGVTVGNNLPEAGAGGEGNGGNKESANRLEETTNYEISHTTETLIREAGGVKRLSVAVLVDGNYAPQEDGSLLYAARSEAELEKINTLVRSAIGFNTERGDQVEVINLQFAARDVPEPILAEEETFLSLTKADYFRIGESATLAILTLIVLLMIVRPLLRRVLSTENMVAANGGTLALAGAGAAGGIPGADGEQALLPAGAAARLAGTTASGEPLPEGAEQVGNPIESMIDIAKIEGQVRESSLKKVAEIIGNHPDETMAILRSWLHEEE
ncbi:MAG: flagellar M-ring protein FliF [Parvibaculaceae bacterium]|nr:flagellar M-ring protein FliF [Parvibaculaceae bacterium]